MRDCEKDASDAYKIPDAMDKLCTMIDGYIPVQDIMNMNGVHNCGISGFTFPPKPVKLVPIKKKEMKELWDIEILQDK